MTSPSLTGWSRPTCWPLNRPVSPPELRVLERAPDVLVDETRHVVDGAARAYRERGAHVRWPAGGLGVDAGDREPLEQERPDRIEPGAGLGRRRDARKGEAAELPEHRGLGLGVVEEIGFRGDRQRGQADGEGIVVLGLGVGRGERRVPVREQRHPPLPEELEDVGGAFQAGGVGEIDDEQRSAGGLERVHDPRHRMVAGDRRQGPRAGSGCPHRAASRAAGTGW